MKRRAQTEAAVAVIFSFLLVFSAARSNTTGRGELGEVQIAMWNLNRVDNLQMSYVYTVRQNAGEGGETMDVCADLLTGSWVSKHYATDEDGTRLYLRQFCDGKNIYHYIDWNGDWEKIQTMGAPSATAMHSQVWPDVRDDVELYLMARIQDRVDWILARYR